MKRWMILAAAAAVLIASVPGFAAGKATLEQRCKAQAERHKIAADKLDTYVKTCVEKHQRKRKPAAAPAPAPAPAMPGM